MIGPRQRILLSALEQAGAQGLTSGTLAKLAGPRFSEYVRRLRCAGVVISAEAPGRSRRLSPQSRRFHRFPSTLRR